ncbi:MAG: DUF2207 domain-containing protein [Methanomassiliicoccaceae archaeon]|nr:DUF2207 domain-containing protein [Methanomassiliicoccaceae archaeon]
MTAGFKGGIDLSRIISVVFVGIFVSVVAFSIMDGFGDWSFDDGFDHYRTDVDIVVGTDGRITQTETYWFTWEDVRSGEMYLSKPAGMAGNIDVISVSIDGYTMSKASSYSQGRDLTNRYPDGSSGRWYYEGINYQTGDYEINAFYPYEKTGGHVVEFKYEVTGAVNRYTDCIDFYYKVYTYFSEDLKDLTVNVVMPAGSLQEKTRIFGHGDPNGFSEFVGSTANAVFTSTNLRAYTMFEIRVVNEQTSLFSMPIRTDKNFASILAEEQKFYDDTQRAILLSKFLPWILCSIVLIIPVSIVLGNKFSKRNKPTFNQPYIREIPTLAPNIVAGLNDYYRITKGNFGNKIAAAVLSLALKEAIAIEKGGKKDPVFVSLDRNAAMTGFERSVHDMIFGCAGGPDRNRVTLKQIKKTMSGNQALGSKLSRNIVDTDKKEFNGHRFTDKKMESGLPKWKIIMLLAVIALTISNMAISIFVEYFEFAAATMFAGFFATIILISYNPKTPLTAKGEDERAKARALKRFYTDMTLIKERRAIELPVWEQHLVYATALGVSDKVIKELNVRLQEMYPASYRPLIYLPIYSQIGNISSNFSSIRSVPMRQFQNSSGGGGGGGGGFSGGGGGGFGGGGGGHR